MKRRSVSTRRPAIFLRYHLEHDDMNKYLTAFAGMLLLVTGSLAQAHGNHDEEAPITRQLAGGRAMSVIGALVQDEKLAPSWAGKRPTEVLNKATPAGALWVITFTNPAEADKSKQTLYILLDGMGNYIGANHNGKY